MRTQENDAKGTQTCVKKSAAQTFHCIMFENCKTELNLFSLAWIIELTILEILLEKLQKNCELQKLKESLATED